MKDIELEMKIGSTLSVTILILSGFSFFTITSDYFPNAEAISIWDQVSVSDLANGTFDNTTVDGNEIAAKILLSNVSGEWIQVDPLTRPEERYAHGMATVWGTDSVILFGGQNHTTKTNLFNDTWEYDFSINNWIKKNTTNHPNATMAFTMATIWGTDKVLLFGGYLPGRFYDETWVYDLSDNTWMKKMPTTKPNGRAEHQMTSIWGTDKILLFAGHDGYNCYNETWIYDLTDNTWTKCITNHEPEYRYGHALVTMWGTDKVVLYGGTGQSPDTNDLWVFDLSDNDWEEKTPPNMPGKRYAHKMLSSTGMDRIVTFSGVMGNIKDDTWEYDLSDNVWRRIYSITSPGGRVYYGLAGIYNTNQAVLFGGYNVPAFLDDTWIYSINRSALFQNGTYVSAQYDTCMNSSFKTIGWSADTTINTSVKFQF